MLTIENLLSKLDATLFTGDPKAIIPSVAFASDLMSDVLTLENQTPLLITGLANVQCIRTAEMADISIIVVARGKQITTEMTQMAESCGITMLSSPFSIFRICGILYNEGIKPIY